MADLKKKKMIFSNHLSSVHFAKDKRKTRSIYYSAEPHRKAVERFRPRRFKGLRSFKAILLGTIAHNLLGKRSRWSFLDSFLMYLALRSRAMSKLGKVGQISFPSAILPLSFPDFTGKGVTY